MQNMEGLVFVGAAIIMVGFVVMVIASLLGSRPIDKKGEQISTMRGGGVIMIGPIPIIFGTDAKWAIVAIILAIVLVLVSLIASGGL